jgi:hypothetical protein
MKRTSNELIAELNDLRDAIEEAKKNEGVVRGAREAASAVRAIYNAFVDQGFDSTQAYELTTIVLNKK